MSVCARCRCIKKLKKHYQNTTRQPNSEFQIAIRSFLHVNWTVLSNAEIQSPTSESGTLAHMPPEAMEGSTHYNSSLDVFSFGHLSLFTVIQSPVHPLLPPSYADPPTGELKVRSEVERREKFIRKAKELLSEDHSLLDLITKCLSNLTTERPCAAQLVKQLQKMKTAAG